VLLDPFGDLDFLLTAVGSSLVVYIRHDGEDQGTRKSNSPSQCVPAERAYSSNRQIRVRGELEALRLVQLGVVVDLHGVASEGHHDQARHEYRPCENPPVHVTARSLLLLVHMRHGIVNSEGLLTWTRSFRRFLNNRRSLHSVGLNLDLI